MTTVPLLEACLPPDKIVIRRGRRFHKNDWPDLHELLNKPTTLLLYPGPTGWHNYLIIKPFAPKINMSLSAVHFVVKSNPISVLFFFSSPFRLLNNETWYWWEKTLFGHWQKGKSLLLCCIPLLCRKQWPWTADQMIKVSFKYRVMLLCWRTRHCSLTRSLSTQENKLALTHCITHWIPGSPHPLYYIAWPHFCFEFSSNWPYLFTFSWKYKNTGWTSLRRKLWYYCPWWNMETSQGYFS